MALTGAPLLVDKSAWERSGAHRSTWGRLDERGLLRICDVTAMELLYSARGSAEFERLEWLLQSMRSLPVDRETMATARTAMRELAARDQHRVSMPDLLVATAGHRTRETKAR